MHSTRRRLSTRVGIGLGVGILLPLAIPVAAQTSSDWRLTGPARATYVTNVDSINAYERQHSLRLTATPESPDTSWAATEGVIDISGYQGSDLLIRAYLRTDNVGAAAMWARIDGESEGKYVNWASDNMSDREITGTTEWTQYEIRLPVPDGARMIVLGSILRGHGTVWVDNIEFIGLAPGGPLTGQTLTNVTDFPFRAPPFMQEATSFVGFEPQ